MRLKSRLMGCLLISDLRDMVQFQRCNVEKPSSKLGITTILYARPKWINVKMGRLGRTPDGEPVISSALGGAQRMDLGPQRCLQYGPRTATKHGAKLFISFETSAHRIWRADREKTVVKE